MACGEEGIVIEISFCFSIYSLNLSAFLLSIVFPLLSIIFLAVKGEVLEYVDITSLNPSHSFSNSSLVGFLPNFLVNCFLHSCLSIAKPILVAFGNPEA
ncbi:hypothetical protein ES703_79809 [subsurface metagenome]